MSPRLAPIASPANALISVSRVAVTSEPSASAWTNAAATSDGGATESLGAAARAPISARTTSAAGRASAFNAFTRPLPFRSRG